MRKIVIIRFVISILTLLFLSSALVYFISSSRKQFYIHSNYTLKTIAQDKSSSINDQINYAESCIKLLSNFVSTQMTERELKNPNEVFSKYTGQLPFDLIEYIRWDGLNFMNSSYGGILLMPATGLTIRMVSKGIRESGLTLSLRWQKKSF